MDDFQNIFSNFLGQKVCRILGKAEVIMTHRVHFESSCTIKPALCSNSNNLDAP